MMWPFRTQADRDAATTIRQLRAELDDLSESYMAVAQQRAVAETAMREMQKAMTDEGVAEIARRATAEIADIYAAGGHSVKTRDIQVHAVVAEAVRKAATGERAWNEGQLAAKAQEAA